MARRKQKQEQAVADEAVVSIVITDLVEADYEKRGVFPALRRRLTNWYPAPKAGGFWVPNRRGRRLAPGTDAQILSSASGLANRRRRRACGGLPSLAPMGGRHGERAGS